MKAKDLLREFAERLLRCPAVAYHEKMVSDEVVRICEEHGLPWKFDRAGNLLVTWQNSPIRPLVLAAHMDHPGFEIIRRNSPTRFRTRFLGGVPPEYFKRGVKVCLHPGGQIARLSGPLDKTKCGRLVAPSFNPPIRPEFAVWDLPAFRLAGDRLTARACDDLIGVAAALTTLALLKRSRARVHVVAAISRAEEVGFQGALLMAKRNVLPRNSLVISLETSRELPPVRMGKGVILRVGDKASIFDSEATRFLAECAGTLAKKQGAFAWQRALMSGGTCEATAYQEYGYQVAAVCVALGNYHNCGPRHRIAAEYVSLNDAAGMVELLAHAARQMPHYPVLVRRLPQRLERLAAEARRQISTR
jgi:endoglucanase